MSRIRTIKPEILEDDRTAALSHGAWRLFVSLFVLADDYGNLRANPQQIAGRAFWAQPTDVDAALAELVAAQLINFYTVNGQKYATINGWAKHQKVDKPGKPHCPGPEQADPEQFATVSRDTRDSLATVSILTPTTTTTETMTPTPTDRAGERISLPEATSLASTVQVQWSETQRSDFSKLKPTRREWMWAMDRAVKRKATSINFLLQAISNDRMRESTLPDVVPGPAPPRAVSKQDQSFEAAMRGVEAFNAQRR